MKKKTPAKKTKKKITKKTRAKKAPTLKASPKASKKTTKKKTTKKKVRKSYSMAFLRNWKSIDPKHPTIVIGTEPADEDTKETFYGVSLGGKPADGYIAWNRKGERDVFVKQLCALIDAKAKDAQKQVSRLQRELAEAEARIIKIRKLKNKYKAKALSGA